MVTSYCAFHFSVCGMWLSFEALLKYRKFWKTRTGKW
jgi:hypothetical protein